MLPTIILSLCLNYTLDIAGAYNRTTNTIEICEYAKDKKRVLTHEIGHFVWWKLFKEEDRKDFEIERNKYNWLGELYRREGINEDFAILFERTFYGKNNEYKELQKWLRQKIKYIINK